MSFYAAATSLFQSRSPKRRSIIDIVTINYYFDHPNGRYYDPIVYLEFSLAYKVTPRLTLNFSTSSAYESQPEYSTEFTANRRLGNYFRSDDRLSAHYSLSHRLSSVTGYS